MKKKKPGIGPWIPTVCKYAFALGFLVLSLKTSGNLWYLFWGTLEFAAIFLISNALVAWKRGFQVLQAFLFLIYNGQNLVVLFGGGYVTLVMLQNLRSLEDLSGKALIYGIGVGAVLTASLWPIRPIDKGLMYFGAGFACTVWIGSSIWGGVHIFNGGGGVVPYTPTQGLWDLARQYRDYRELQELMESFSSPSSNRTEETRGDEKLHSEEALIGGPGNGENISGAGPGRPVPPEIPGGQAGEESREVIVMEDLSDLAPEAAALTDYSESIPSIDHPYADGGTNVILIFIEGMSENIMSDSRGIMPCLANLKNQSVFFENYYDHTFATYRGLQGQLFSGHNYNDLDSNRMTGLADVLRDQGYRSVFINTEPKNEDFTAYLEDLHFDTVQSALGGSLFVADKTALNILFDTAENYHGKGKPFFLAMYTFGTHASLDAVDQLYGDGSDRVLNRFYNLDYYLGVFMQRFMNSDMKDDTMVVITADHATYADEDYLAAFPGVDRPCPDVDTIPFLIYYRGSSLSVDAGGRNSLDLAPTLLDIMGLEAPATFLGNSSFRTKLPGRLDCYFWDPTYVMYTGNSRVEAVDDTTRQRVAARLAHYFSVK